MDLTTTLALVALFVLLEGFFSGTELALISINRPRLTHLIEHGNRAAKMLEEQLKLPARLYGTTSLGTNLMVVSGTAVMTAYFAKNYPGDPDLWAMLVMAPLTLLLGEIIPKAFFQRWADRVSYIAVYPLKAAEIIFTPVLWITSGISRLMLGIVGVDEKHDVRTVTYEEIRRHFSLAEKEFDLHPDEKKMIHRIFDIKNTTAEQCMVPLINLTAVGENETVKSVKSRLYQSGFSRLPVYKDKIYNITGILNAFDMLSYGAEARVAQDLARPAFYVYQSKKINDMLAEMQRADVQMAIVVNEYSAAIGIVTREDLVEEIFGEIEDEYDKRPPTIEQLGPNRWLVDASVEVDMLNERFGWNLPLGDYETIAGYILIKLERIPKKGEKSTIGDFEFTVREATERGLQKVEVRKFK
jgi:CBS domain containing-hemolysin-like protein